jgi:hypothetical protein
VSIKIRRPADGNWLKQGLAFMAGCWQRVEKRWEENPGYVAAATAGTIGIILALSLMVNAGLDWFGGPPDDQISTVAEDDLGDDFNDDLGDPAANVMRGLRREAADDEADMLASRDDADDSTDEANDPFDRPLKFGREFDPKISEGKRSQELEDDDDAEVAEISKSKKRAAILKSLVDEDEEIDVAENPLAKKPATSNPLDDEEEDEFQPPLRDQVAESKPRRQSVIEEEDDEMEDDIPSKPVATQPIQENRTPSKAATTQPAPKLDVGPGNESADEDLDDSIAKEMVADASDETEDAEINSQATPKEPGILKTISGVDSDVDSADAARLLETEDEIDRRDSRPTKSVETEPESKPEPKPKPETKPEAEIQRARPEPATSASRPGWQQQRKPSEDQPAAEARRNRSAETKVEGTRETRPPRVVAAAPAPRDRGTAQKSSVQSPADLPLVLSIDGPGHVANGEACSYVLSVKNTGTTQLRDLIVSIELPPGLVHEVAQSLEQDVASLPAGGTHRSLLKLRATQPGQATIQADIVSARRVVAKLTARVQVGSKSAARVVLSDCESEIVR